MAAFPRTILPRSATPLRGAGALQSIGNTGKIQRRSVMQKGRWWTETYPAFRPGDATGRAFLAFVDEAWGAGSDFTIEHRNYLTHNGGGSGSPLVNGAGQTGTSLATDTWGGSNPVLKAGDLIKIGTFPVIMLTADAPNLSAGATTLTIWPPFYSGNSPANNAAITYTGVTFSCVLLNPPEVGNIPPGDLLVGYALTFMEAIP